MFLLAELIPWDGDRSSRPERPAVPRLVRWLIERSHAVRYEDAEEMLFWAHLGRLAADACPVKDARSERRLADLRARAWGQFGNSVRVCGRLAEAEEAFTIAERHRSRGTGDLSLRATLSEQLTALQICERHFEDAVESIDEAERIHRLLGDRQAWARTLVQRGIAALYRGEPERAVRSLERAIPTIDSAEDPHLLLAARHNLVRCHLDLGRITDALSLHLRMQGAYSESPDSLLMLRATWQQGQLLRELGRLDSAEAALRRARDGFVERGLAYEAAVVSLDLAAVHAKQGQAPATGRVLAEAIPIFRALRIGRETLASMAELRRTLTH